jgi:hypothetical protein
MTAEFRPTFEVTHASQRRLAVRSAVPGRVRWHSPAVHHRPRIAAAVGDAIATCQGVTASEVNPLTGSVLVHFNAARINVCALERIVLDALERPPIALAAWKRRVELERQHQALKRQLRDGHSRRAWHLGLDGVMLAGMVVRQLVPKVFAAIFAPPWAILASAALVLDALMFFRGVRDGFQPRHQSSDVRLTGWLSMFVEWNVYLFGGIWLLNLAMYLQWRSDRLARTALTATASATSPIRLGYSQTVAASGAARHPRRPVVTEPPRGASLPDIHIQLPASAVSLPAPVRPPHDGSEAAPGR